MKNLLVCFFVLLNIPVSAQTPGLTIILKMDSVKAKYISYKFELKVCEPLKKTETNDWFRKDTSKIDFANLRAQDISCKPYISNWKTDTVTGAKRNIYNEFQLRDQVFAWEKIFVVKISNWSSRGWWPEMYIVIPMKYKAFITYLELTDIDFDSGKLIYLDNLENTRTGMSLSMKKSLKNEKTIKVQDFPLKVMLEKN